MDVFNRLTGGNPTEEYRDEEEHELLVFGYQCKIFRDDEKALYVDRHRHLIPWMGDPSLMIDRYDGRGHLHDLHRYDADKSKAQFEVLTDEEKRIEALCDEERYLEFHTDLTERAMYEEEELKRLNEAVSEEYAAVGYSYDYDQDGNITIKKKEEEKESDEEEDEEFVAPPTLQIPVGMVTPAGSKLAAIIEKTAIFISQHGLQMEIMIKMKQKDNMQFSFLNHGDELNPFYKHVVAMIKAGKYKPEPPKEHKRNRTSSENINDGYLHPSLAVTTNPSCMISEEPKDVLSIIQDKLPAGQIKNTAYAKLVNEIGRQQTGRYSPLLSRHFKSGSSSPVQLKPSIPLIQGQSLAGIDQLPKSTISHPPEHYMAVMERPQLPSLVPSYMDPSVPLPPPPGMEPVMLPTSDQPPPPGTEPSHLPPDSTPSLSLEEQVEPLPQKHPEKLVPPPSDIKPIVDKMAMYVAKNGPEFEATVRNKGDERFAFLLDHHPFYPYYESKRLEHEQELAGLKGDHQTGGAAMGPGKGFGFKIKAKETDAATLRTKTALLYESSDDDDESKERKRQKAEAGDSVPYEPSLPTADDDSMDGMDKQIPVTESVEKSEKKLAEEKLKDKLAMAARGKLVQNSKEKQLQAERKRKAAMFLTMIKGSQPEESGPKASLSEENNQKKEITSSDKPSPPTMRKHSRSRSPPHFIRRRRSRSKSPVVSRHRRSRSPLEVRDRRSKRSPKYRRSRSKSPWKRRSKTPPTAFAAFRRSTSRSPRRKKSRSKSPSKPKKSKSKSKKRSRSRSKSKSKAKAKKRSRSRSPKHKSKSKSSRSKRSRSRSKSPSKKKSKSKKKSRSRSPATKKKSRSRSPKRKETSRSRSRSRIKSAIPSPSHDTQSSIAADVEIIHIDDSLPEVEAKGNGTKSNGSARNGSTASFTLPEQTATNTLENQSLETASPDTSNVEPDKPVSMDLLSKVRAMLKASREAIAKEGDMG